MSRRNSQPELSTKSPEPTKVPWPAWLENDPSVYRKMTITPDLALQWLTQNTHNRSIRRGWVKELARRILNGLWRTTHQGIAFDETGLLIDGQHRLLAILEAETAIVMWVFFAADIADQLVVDDHGKRSPFDALSLADISLPYELTRDHVSIARSMWGYSTAQTKIANQELRDFMQGHSKAINFAFESLMNRGKKKRLTIATLAAAVARAYYHVDKARLREFCEVIYSGTSSGDQDSAAIRLRDWLLTTEMAMGGGSAKRVIHRRCERAISAFCDYKPLAKLYPVANEIYPIAGDNNEEQEG